MNKKALKYVLIVSGIVLLLGLGIYGYKYIKNKNSHKNTNENQLKEVSNLTKVDTYSPSAGSGYSFTVYYNGPININGTSSVACSDYSDQDCFWYNFYGTIYVNDSVKLKSSWVLYKYEYPSPSGSPSFSSSGIFKYSSVYSNYLLLKISTVRRAYYSGKKFESYPYTKIFNATTGDMIFEVPTNSNEKINLSNYYVGGSCSWNGNMVLDTFSNSGTIYYAKSNYNLTNGNNVEIHKVTFNSNNTYTDSIYSYTNATITTNS